MKKIIYFFFCFFLFYPIIVDAHNIEREKEKPYISDNKRDFSFYAPLNDDCPEAVTLTVNTSHECVTSFSSNFQGATPSGLPNTCAGVPNDDIWFEFIALSSVQVITLSNVTGNAPIVSGTLYSGTCNSLTQVSCLSSAGTGANRIDNLIMGETYRIRLFSMVSQINTVSSFDICITTLSPPIKVSTVTTNTQITENLIKHPGCIEISNIQTKSGKDYDEYILYPANAVEGIGLFEKNNSLFPFEKGVVLSTGNVLSAPGPKTTQDQSSGSTFWTGDNDLNDLLTAQNIGGATLHASSIEFDFISSTDYLRLDYLLASDEYGNRCDNYDLVAFFLTDPNTGVTTNLATVPNTNTIISPVTIKDGQYQQFPINCTSLNAAYFGNYYNGVSFESQSAPVNFRGTTIPMKATATVLPNQIYHLKIVIAEQKNNFSAGPGGVIYFDSYDTAVFIDGLSSVPDVLDLGPDYLIESNTALCNGDSAVLSTDLNPQIYTFQWYKNDLLISGANHPSLTVSTPGIYRLDARYGSACIISDEVTIEMYPSIYSGADIPTLETCVFGTTVTPLDITINKQFIESHLLIDVDQTELYFYESENDAIDGVDPITNITNYTPAQLPQNVYVSLLNKTTGCIELITFMIISKTTDFVKGPENIKLCVYDGLVDRTDLTIIESELRAQTESDIHISYYISEQQAQTQSNSIDNPKEFYPMALPVTIYVLIIDETTGCKTITSFQLIESEVVLPVSFGDVVICTQYILPALPENQFYSTEEYGKGTVLSTGSILKYGTHLYYINSVNNEGCIASTEQRVEVINCSVQKGISPNGDGLNDAFDLTNYHPLEVSIYNRYGKQVYHHANGYNNQWTGQDSTGKSLPDGTYYYRIVTVSEELTGYIYLLREVK